MNRLTYFANAFLCALNFVLWMMVDGKFATLVVVLAGVACVWSLVTAVRLRDPYYYRG